MSVCALFLAAFVCVAVPRLGTAQDTTNAAGACRVCDLAIEEILAKVPELAKSVRQSQRAGGQR